MKIIRLAEVRSEYKVVNIQIDINGLLNFVRFSICWTDENDDQFWNESISKFHLTAQIQIFCQWTITDYWTHAIATPTMALSFNINNSVVFEILFRFVPLQFTAERMNIPNVSIQ